MILARLVKLLALSFLALSLTIHRVDDLLDL